MSNRPKKYDVTGNIESQFADDAKTVLVNKRDIIDLHSVQLAEEEGLARAYERLLGEVRTDTPIDCSLIKHIHSIIFGDLYDWAGRWRTVQISKPGAIWPAAQFLDDSMQSFERDVCGLFPSKSIYDDDAFCITAGEIQGEFLAIHPFREGNARTIKLATDLLAAQTGRPLLRYDQSPVGVECYIEAARSALLRKDYSPMIAVIKDALAAAQMP